MKNIINKCVIVDSIKRKFSKIFPFAFLLVSFLLFVYYYIIIRHAFFDDVYIYLHIAKNGADSFTWQYFPVVDRPSLIASSPLKIILLTISSFILSIFGISERTFFTAKLTLVVYAILALIIWIPFWKNKIKNFIIIGGVYFFISNILDSVVDFEGGLLILWISTLFMLKEDMISNTKKLSWLLPIGIFIRPDFTLPIYVWFFFDILQDEKKELILKTITRLITYILFWITLCYCMSVWPIPSTYLAKAAIPKLVENFSMLEVFLQRIGLIIIGKYSIVNYSNVITIIIGILVILNFIIVGYIYLNNEKFKKDKIFYLVLPLLVFIILLIKLPANFWWYYQYALIINFLIIVFFILFNYSLFYKSFLFKTSTIFTILFIAIIIINRFWIDGPLLWSIKIPSRGQGYQYIASRIDGQGLYNFPEIGKCLIKNPEMGMISYFSGSNAWIWDSAGLVQFVDDKKVKNHPLSFFYPRKLFKSPFEDAKYISNINKISLKVVEVWAMEDRNFENAKKVAKWVIKEGAIIANPFIEY